jgi:hypothetical protein
MFRIDAFLFVKAMIIPKNGRALAGPKESIGQPHMADKLLLSTPP